MSLSVIKWLLLAAVSLSFTLISYPLAPLVVLFADEEGWLPRWLWWFQTPDNTLDGDNGWKTEHWQWRYKLPRCHDGVYLTPCLAKYCGRVGWLWRNAGYGLDKYVLGVEVSEDYWTAVVGDERVSNRPLFEGRAVRYLSQGRNLYWQFYYVKAWSKTRCIRVNLGWKLWGDLKAGDRCSLVVSVNPFMGYSND